MSASKRDAGAPLRAIFSSEAPSSDAEAPVSADSRSSSPFPYHDAQYSQEDVEEPFSDQSSTTDIDRLTSALESALGVDDDDEAPAWIRSTSEEEESDYFAGTAALPSPRRRRDPSMRSVRSMSSSVSRLSVSSVGTSTLIDQLLDRIGEAADGEDWDQLIKDVVPEHYDASTVDTREIDQWADAHNVKDADPSPPTLASLHADVMEEEVEDVEADETPLSDRAASSEPPTPFSPAKPPVPEKASTPASIHVVDDYVGEGVLQLYEHGKVDKSARDERAVAQSDERVGSADKHLAASGGTSEQPQSNTALSSASDRNWVSIGSERVTRRNDVGITTATASGFLTTNSATQSLVTKDSGQTRDNFSPMNSLNETQEDRGRKSDAPLPRTPVASSFAFLSASQRILDQSGAWGTADESTSATGLNDTRSISIDTFSGQSSQNDSYSSASMDASPAHKSLDEEASREVDKEFTDNISEGSRERGQMTSVDAPVVSPNRSLDGLLAAVGEVEPSPLENSFRDFEVSSDKIRTPPRGPVGDHAADDERADYVDSPSQLEADTAVHSHAADLAADSPDSDEETDADARQESERIELASGRGRFAQMTAARAFTSLSSLFGAKKSPEEERTARKDHKKKFEAAGNSKVETDETMEIRSRSEGPPRSKDDTEESHVPEPSTLKSDETSISSEDEAVATKRAAFSSFMASVMAEQAELQAADEEKSRYSVGNVDHIQLFTPFFRADETSDDEADLTSMTPSEELHFLAEAAGATSAHALSSPAPDVDSDVTSDILLPGSVEGPSEKSRDSSSGNDELVLDLNNGDEIASESKSNSSHEWDASFSNQADAALEFVSTQSDIERGSLVDEDIEEPLVTSGAHDEPSVETESASFERHSPTDDKSALIFEDSDSGSGNPPNESESFEKAPTAQRTGTEHIEPERGVANANNSHLSDNDAAIASQYASSGGSARSPVPSLASTGKDADSTSVRDDKEGFVEILIAEGKSHESPVVGVRDVLIQPRSDQSYRPDAPAGTELGSNNGSSRFRDPPAAGVYVYEAIDDLTELTVDLSLRATKNRSRPDPEEGIGAIYRQHTATERLLDPPININKIDTINLTVTSGKKGNVTANTATLPSALSTRRSESSRQGSFHPENVGEHARFESIKVCQDSDRVRDEPEAQEERGVMAAGLVLLHIEDFSGGVSITDDSIRDFMSIPDWLSGFSASSEDLTGRSAASSDMDQLPRTHPSSAVEASESISVTPHPTLSDDIVASAPPPKPVEDQAIEFVADRTLTRELPAQRMTRKRIDLDEKCLTSLSDVVVVSEKLRRLHLERLQSDEDLLAALTEKPSVCSIPGEVSEPQNVRRSDSDEELLENMSRHASIHDRSSWSNQCYQVPLPPDSPYGATLSSSTSSSYVIRSSKNEESDVDAFSDASSAYSAPWSGSRTSDDDDSSDPEPFDDANKSKSDSDEVNSGRLKTIEGADTLSYISDDESSEEDADEVYPSNSDQDSERSRDSTQSFADASSEEDSEKTPVADDASDESSSADDDSVASSSDDVPSNKSDGILSRNEERVNKSDESATEFDDDNSVEDDASKDMNSFGETIGSDNGDQDSTIYSEMENSHLVGLNEYGESVGLSSSGRDIETGLLSQYDEDEDTDDEIDDYGEDKSKFKSWKSTLTFRYAAISLTLVGAVITIAVLLTGSNDLSTALPPPIATPTSVPTDQPSPSPTFVPVPTVRPPMSSRPTTSTNPPSPTPTLPTGEWTRTTGPLVSVGSMSVSYSPLLMVVGSATFNEIRTFLGDEDGRFVQTDDNLSITMNGNFGASVALTELLGNSVMLVGAPMTPSDEFGPDLPFGAAHFFRWQVNRWVPLGKPITPELGPGEVNGLFGETVAVAPNRLRFAVGAPGTSLVSSNTVRAGRTYIYEYINSAWSLTFSIDGIMSNGSLGSSLDMSENGNVVVAGAPSEEGGYVVCFARQGSSTWVNTFFETGSVVDDSPEGAAFGSSVAMMSESGDRFAVGAPNAFNGVGAVRVYELSSNGAYTQLGSDIVGSESGEALGRPGTLSGGNGELFAAAGSVIHKYTWNGSDWVVVEAINNGLSVAALSTASNGGSLATLGSPSVVSVYFQT